MFPPRRPANEHQLAGVCAGVCERNAPLYRPGRTQNLAQTVVSEGCVFTWAQHHSNYCFCMLLCKYLPLFNFWRSFASLPKNEYYYSNSLPKVYASDRHNGFVVRQKPGGRHESFFCFSPAAGTKMVLVGPQGARESLFPTTKSVVSVTSDGR